MKILLLPLLALSSLACLAQMSSMPMKPPAQSSAAAAPERLGTVNFSTSCAPGVQDQFNRGVALLHDFWYEEAIHQFQQIEKADPNCSMAHWGAAMAYFHQIWNRPDKDAMAQGWAEMQKAQSPPAKTARERAYIAALTGFYRPGPLKFSERVLTYSDEMGMVYTGYPDDIDAGAFYALSLLAAAPDSDTTLLAQHRAMSLLTPLFDHHPDNPGVVHYTIHACDNPSMASFGLAAANHYGDIAPSGAHAYHMPGHIYARLGMWPQDIEANLGSVAAARAAEAKYGSGIMDEPHAFDFLLYAYLQSGQDERAKWVLTQVNAALDQMAAMPAMDGQRMVGMVPYYRTKFQVFYALETRNWQAAAALEPAPGSSPATSMLAVWARIVAHGHLHQAEEARADLARYNLLLDELKKSKDAYMAEDTGARVERDEVMGWFAFAQGRQEDALRNMRAAADLQDKVGQGEVDIPAREMLADMLLEFRQPQRALAEYEAALKLSPNRLNGLYHAGAAAEASGNRVKAQRYYILLLKTTGNGSLTSRTELDHAKTYVAWQQRAAQ